MMEPENVIELEDVMNLGIDSLSLMRVEEETTRGSRTEIWDSKWYYKP